MKRAVALSVAVFLVSAASVGANTPQHHTWIICDNGARYTHKPSRCDFRIGGGRTVSVHRLHWHNWGARRTIAHGKSGGRVRVAARDRTKVTNCTGQPRTDWFYEKVTLRIKGKTRHVDGSSLKPQCNNP
jgi:hypothetical protein